MWNQNEWTRTCNVKYPIIQAGMAGGVTTPELVAAVSNFGAVGSLGAGYLNGENTAKAIREIKMQTNKPFAVNLFVPEQVSVTREEARKASEHLQSFYKMLDLDPVEKLEVPSPFDEQVEQVIKHNVSMCSFTFGIPDQKVIQALKEANVYLIGTATTVEEAVMNEEAGLDAVVVQGSEAGGHRGSFAVPPSHALIGLMSLIPQVRDAINIPVIAAGGIADARGVLACLLLGADGVQMGTPFVTTKESGANPLHKEAVLQAKETDTVLTKSFSGKPARGINNAFIRDMDGKEVLPYPVQNAWTKGIRKEAARRGLTDYMSLWSGQSPSLAKLVHAHTLLEEIVRNIEHKIERGLFE